MLPHSFRHDSQAKTLVLVVNLGSPSEPTAKGVSKFLREFLSDQRVVELPRLFWRPLLNLLVLPLRSKRVARLYQHIFTQEGSPLTVGTARIAAQLDANLGNDMIKVDFAMRYGQHNLSEKLDGWRNQRLERLVILPLYPQYAASTTGAAFDEVARILMHWRWVPDVQFVGHFYADQRYINALVDTVKPIFKEGYLLLMSFHGVPTVTLKQGDPYYCQCHKTARLLATQLGLKDHQWRLTFQSRFGKQPWLEPYTDKTLLVLPKEGIKKVQVICPGFSVDCLETLEEINQDNRSLFLNAGGESFEYIPCLNEQSRYLEDIVSDRLALYQKLDDNQMEPKLDQDKVAQSLLKSKEALRIQ